MNGARPRWPASTWRMLAALLAAACNGVPDPEHPASAPGQSVQVAATPDLEPVLAPLLRQYQAAAGVAVSARYADGLQEEADLLVLAGAEAAVMAADEGALRPLPKMDALDAIPVVLRDPDAAWLALTWQPLAVAYDVRRTAAADVASYAALAAPGLAGQLCLTSASLPSNQALLAALIAANRERPAEILVRGWIAQLGAPVYESDAALLSAIAAGRCAVGVVPRAPAEPGGPAISGTIRYTVPVAPAGVVVVGGIGRHARQPEAARALLQWFAMTAAWPAAARDAADDRLPAEGPAVTGWLHDDARKLAERAGYR